MYSASIQFHSHPFVFYTVLKRNMFPLFRIVGWWYFMVLFVVCVNAEEEVLCTHGKLFLSDTSTNQIRVMDLNIVEPVGNLIVETTVTVDGGPGDMDLYSTANGKTIATLYGGSIDLNYTDGVVNWIHTGIELVNHGDHSDVSFNPPTVLPNGAFRCAQAVHFERNNGAIVIFCDGSYRGNVNSTVWVLDESTLTDSGENPMVFNTTLLGSHHGVAVPVCDNDVLYSVASPERVNRSDNASDYTLPSMFEIVDIASGAVIYRLNDTSDADTHCSGYHGAAYFENTILLACDDVHGGVVIVDYNDTLNRYTSRALFYPTSASYDGHRAAHFEQHTKSDYIIGDFNDGEESFHLIAFRPSDTVLTEMNVLPLSTLQCGFAYEKSSGEVVLILMPDGMLLAYEYDSGMGWTKISELLVYDGMTACNEVLFVVGYVQAFVITTTNDAPTIYAVDLHHVHHDGTMTFTTSTIDFTPYSAVVGGVPPLVACSFDGSQDHHQDDDHNNNNNHTVSKTNITGTSQATVKTSTNHIIISVFAAIMVYSIM